MMPFPIFSGPKDNRTVVLVTEASLATLARCAAGVIPFARPPREPWMSRDVRAAIAARLLQERST
jgi:hypothetical protein